MIYLEGLRKVEKIPWKEIEPGMIFLGGIRINDTVPFELRDFPVLSPSIIQTLSKKYYFLASRDVLVVRAKRGYSPSKLSRNLIEIRENIINLNAFRSAYLKEKETIIKKCGISSGLAIPLIETECVESQFLIQTTYNSFTPPHPIPQGIEFPSLFHSLKTAITLGHVLTKKLASQFNVVHDEEVLLHLVVGVTPGITEGGKVDVIISALGYFQKFFSDLLKNTEMKFYVFSHECKPVMYPVSCREIQKADAHFSSFVKKVLHFKDTTKHNKVILFTDSKPADISNALHYGRLFKKNNIDFTQIICNIRENGDGSQKQDALVDTIADELTQFAETCGGNQIIVNANDCIPVIALEAYDHYIGFLTLIDPDYMKPELPAQSSHSLSVGPNKTNEYKNGKIIKKWKPKVIRRPR